MTLVAFGTLFLFTVGSAGPCHHSPIFREPARSTPSHGRLTSRSARADVKGYHAEAREAGYSPAACSACSTT